MRFGNPVRGRILAFGETRDAGEEFSFRVTQRFADVHPQFGPHRALDLGNFRCNDPVLAAASGTARTFTDSAGALIVVIRHGDGWETVYAHLNRYSIAQGSSIPVVRGQQIGLVGSTGLGGVCHLHFETKLNGAHQDPWPLLEQNGVDDMLIQGRWADHIVNRRTAVSVLAANFREGPNLSAKPLATYGKGTALFPIVAVEGQEAGGATPKIWFGAWLWVANRGWSFGYMHSSTVGPLTRAEAADCSAVEKRLAAVKSKVATMARDVADD